MAEDSGLTPNSSNTQERTLLDVVNELKELNQATQVAQDSATYTQDLRDYVTSQGDNLSSRQLTAINDLISAISDGELDQMEMDKERIKRNEDRNDLLEKIANATSLSLAQLQEEFGGKDRGFIMGAIINTAIRGLLIGFFASAFLEPFKLIGKGLSAIGTKIGKLLGFTGFFKGLKVSIQTNVTNGFKAFMNIFKSKGNKPPGFLAKTAMELKKILIDTFKIVGTVIGNVTKVGGAAAGFLAGRFKALESLTKLKFNFPVTSKLMAGISKGLNAFFKPLNGLTKLFSGQANVVVKSVDRAGKALGSSSKVVSTLGTSIVKFFGALKPIKTVFGFLSKLGNAFKGVGRVLGRFFGIFNFIFGFFKGFKKYEDGSFLTKVFAGIMGGFKQMLLMGPVFLLDGIKWVLTKITGALGFEGLTGFLESFSFAEIVGGAFDFVTDTIINFFALMRDTIADIGIGGIVKNIGINLLKVFKKIAMFPSAVAAGGFAALSAALPGGETPMEGFTRGFNAVFTAGDAALDNLKVKADGMTASGEEIKSKSEENAAGQASLSSKVADAGGNLVDASKNAVTNVGETIINTVMPQDRTSATVEGPYA